LASSSPITLDNLIALNDEIASLARAGVPLDRGLVAIGKDMPGRLGRIAQSLGRRLESGEDLAAALSQSGSEFPAIYRAVVLAGLRSGRLSVALEGIAKTARRVMETRRIMLVSMVYPLVIMVVASSVFWITMSITVPTIQLMFEDFGLTWPRWYAVLSWLAELLLLALPWIWGVAIILLAIFLISISRASVLGEKPGRRSSTIGQILRAGRLATFAETLALLLEQELPLAEALELACQSSGDHGLKTAGDELAQAIRRGQPLSRLPVGFPPLLGWMLMGGGQPGQLVTALRRLAETYRRRAAKLCAWLTIYLPMTLSAGVCGLVVAAYVLLAMAPLYFLLYQMSLPS
jgi:general secretion pathway protein F